MAYALLDDQLPDHPKIEAAGPLAGWLYVCGLAYCTRLLTDGFIPAARVYKLTSIPPDEVTQLVTRLLTVQLWEEADGGYQVHDFLKHNPTAEEVKAKRAKAAKRQARWKAAHLGAHIKEGSNGVSDALAERHERDMGRRVSDRAPRPSHIDSSSPNGEGTPDADAPDVPAVKAVPKPNKSGELIALLSARDVPLEMTPRDHAALKRSRLTAAQVAEAYEAAYRGEWAEEWLQNNLCVAVVIGRWAGFMASKQPRTSKPSSRGPGAWLASRPQLKALPGGTGDADAFASAS